MTMNRTEFFNELNKLLKNIPTEEKEEVLYDYNEHFEIGLKEGRTEEDIIESLGDINSIAKEIKANHMIGIASESNKVGDVFRAILATFGLGFFNLIFVLGPFLGICGALLGLFIGGVGIVIGGIGIVFGTFLQPLLPQYVNIPVNSFVSIFAGIGTIALGLLWTIGMYYLTKGFFKVTTKYLKANYNIIVNRRSSDEKSV